MREESVEEIISKKRFGSNNGHKHYAQIIQSSHEFGIMSFDPKRIITSWNIGAQKIFGWSETEAIGRISDILFTSEDKRTGRPDREANMAVKEGKAEDTRWHLRKDGSLVYISGCMSPLYDEHGALEGFTKIARDITEQKKAEEALKESENRFRKLTNAIPSFVWMYGKNGEAIFHNDKWYEATGVTPEESLGFGWVNTVHPDDRDAFVEKWKRCVQLELPFEAETRYRMKNGEYCWFLVRSEAVRDSNGLIECWIGADIDINERKLLEDKIKYANDNLEKLVNERTVELSATIEELQRSNRELEAFAFIASHDLQEPLRMVKNYVQLLLITYKESPNSEEIENYKNIIIDSVDRMRSLINDLLTYSRVRTQPLNPKKVSIENILLKVKNNLQVSIDESKAEITHDPMPEILADETQITQLFQNLISNAIKFRSARPLKIYISARRNEQNLWEFGIKDNGIGIEKEFFDRIFIIFQRLHSRTHSQGTGLGLAICKLITERHRGKIWVESQVNQGTTFYFTLPPVEEY
jgi:PAS domain S-box-containing protein